PKQRRTHASMPRTVSRLASGRLADTPCAATAATDPAHAGPRAAAAAAPPGWPVHTPGPRRPRDAPDRAERTTASPRRLAPDTRAAGDPAVERAAAAPGSLARSPSPVPERDHTAGGARAAPARSPGSPW